MKNQLNLQFFAANTNTNTTTDSGLSEEMKTFYSDYLIDNAEPRLVHDQFAQKRPIPQGNGKIVEFRKYDPLPKLTTPITEGVTPDGQKLSMVVQNATVKQYGGYVEFTDILLLTAIDNNLVMATKLLGSQAGRTLDTITREVLAGGTSVQYGEDAVSARYLLTGGATTGNHYLTVDAIRRAVRALKNANAETVGGSYAAIIHPDATYDLMNDPKWVSVKSYSDPSGIYEGEIGKIENVRFVESTEAKIFHAEDLTANDRALTVRSAVTSATVVPVSEAITSADAAKLPGRKVIIGARLCEIASATAANAGSASVTLKSAVSASASAKVYPGEAGADGRDVYATMIFGDNAYGTTEITGGGLQHIVKQLGSAGTADPLNQRATVGWKATKVAVRLVETFMVRIETASTFEAGEN